MDKTGEQVMLPNLPRSRALIAKLSLFKKNAVALEPSPSLRCSLSPAITWPCKLQAGLILAYAESACSRLTTNKLGILQ